jgi:hypothetical protein
MCSKKFQRQIGASCVPRSPFIIHLYNLRTDIQPSILPPPLVRHAALVRGDHVLDVYEGVLPPLLLEELEGPHDALAHALLLLLRVVDAVPQVFGVVLEQVQHGQDLAVVRHQRLAHHLLALHQFTQQLQGRRAGVRRFCDLGLGSINRLTI